MSEPTSSSLTVHHLQRSQSERIVWLLEEMGLPYHLVIHRRDPLLAPPAVKALTELGTAPVLIDGELKLGESMAIATYLVEKYGKGEYAASKGLLQRQGDEGWTDYLYWLYFALNTLQPAGSATMFAYFDPSLTDESPGRSFPRGRFQRALKSLDGRLSNNEFLAGKQFSLADIMVLFPLTHSRVFIPYSLAPYGNILAYLARITKRDAYVRAMQKAEGGLPVLSGPEPGEKKAKF